jgi:hypothetical protein
MIYQEEPGSEKMPLPFAMKTPCSEDMTLNDACQGKQREGTFLHFPTAHLC